MEKDRSVLDVKKIKLTIFLGVSIIIHLEDFVYHKRLFFTRMSEWRFRKKKKSYGIHTTVPPRIVLLNEFVVEQVPSVEPPAS